MVKVIQLRSKSKSTKYSFLYQLNSFKYAFQGLKSFFKTDPKAIIHSFFLIAAVILGLILDNTQLEWVMIFLAAAIVIIAELFNFALEKAGDAISEGFSPTVKLIKDVSAASVLIACISAFVTGCIIYLPKLFYV